MPHHHRARRTYSEPDDPNRPPDREHVRTEDGGARNGMPLGKPYEYRGELREGARVIGSGQRRPGANFKGERCPDCGYGTASVAHIEICRVDPATA